MTVSSHDHHDEPLTIPSIDVSPIRPYFLGMAGIGILAFLALSALQVTAHEETGLRDVFLTYLCGWVFWACLPIGALGLTQIGYLTSASWGVVFRRTFRASMRTWPLIAILAIPIFASLYYDGGKHSPFWWSNIGWTEAQVPTDEAKKAAFEKEKAKLVSIGWDETLASLAAANGVPPHAVEENHEKQHGYDNAPIITGLNPTNVLARFVIVMAVLGILMFFLNKWGDRNEASDDLNAYWNLRAISGPGMVIWALFTTSLLTDFVMSVEPTWASSMFPLVFGMNCFVCSFCIGILTFYTINAKQADVLGIVKEKFRLDIGSLLLAFTMVWAYATFCQYMLIWAGNLPEESVYYLKRGNGGWQYLAYILMIFHWLVPFVVLLFRSMKTNPNKVRILSLMLLAVCAADIVWWIVPAVAHPEGGYHLLMGFAAIIGVGGFWGLYFLWQLSRHAILPANRETKFLATWGHH